MRKPVYSLSQHPCPLLLTALFAAAGSLLAQDSELTNYKSGIDVTWGGTKGVDYYEEYFYHDKLIDDHKVVYIKSTTPISMGHNARNIIIKGSTVGGRTIVGVNGEDGIPNSGDEGTIRYKIDRDRQYLYKWSQNSSGTEPFVFPAYSGPFTLASQEFEPGVPVVGTTGSNGGPLASKSAYYFRGILDSFGDEWHVLSYADDDRPGGVAYEMASDGKTVLLVVNPKTPCFTARATGSGQFFTTPPKAYFTPKIVPQTTYISGTVSIELRDINGNDVSYQINGGGFVTPGGSTVTLNETNFAAGSNTLEYRYAGGATKTRIVVKDPPHPSLAEPHGNYLIESPANLLTIKSRITRAPYLSTYNAYKTRADNSGQANWDLWAYKGYRINPIPTGALQGSTFSLINAFVALVEGSSFTRTGASKSYALYAKEMLLENSRNIDPLGFEMQHSSDMIPSRELHYRGYYDSNPVLHAIFAYDIVVANFRSDQISGGLTPIEDYFVRDRFAGFAYEAMQWTASMTALNGPGMWGGARMMTAVSIGMIMREYSTPYYGTSGFGAVQTTYPLCPYESDQLTWKRALFDGTATISEHPNFKWNTGFSDNDHGANVNLFMNEGEILGGRAYPLGTWTDKAAYFGAGIMGNHMMIWANMAKLWGGGKTDPRFEIAIEAATKGTLIGAKDPFPQTGRRFPMLLLLNSRWSNAVTNNLAYVQALPSSDNDSDDKNMSVFAFAWYDDAVGGPVIPPPPTVTAPANAKVSISVSSP